MTSIGYDSLIMTASVGSGLVGLALAFYMFYRARPRRDESDVDRIVKTAPYNRLHNILKVEKPT